jgi:ATP-binding cassette subfamily G (WHITE) protein 5 (sterolin 1)
MGSSGAGKTTLLNLLAGRAQGKIEGELLLNGHSVQEAKSLRKYSTYIMQDDVLLENQTPREILSFSSKMKISGDHSKVKNSQQILIFRNKNMLASKK